MEEQIKDYNKPFPTIFRQLLDCHPITGKKTTLKALGELLGIRQQSISQYKLGESQPTPENLLKMANYFGVSVDYMLTGVSSENKSVHEELGLSDASINFIKLAKSNGMISQLDKLLSDRDFYEFLEDVEFKSEQVRKVLDGKYDKEKYEHLNVEEYFIWDLQKYVEEFILKQLQKNGLTIENNTIVSKE